ncbi:DUF4124 domain-containing protein [Paludibacterium yongneupense]|uniref:DUF4124 domain-containing protein n=1 Tax=Paludibacterium yongneupense TaxID=400061 RepID=UPI0004196CD9|nr:DUF4124 domain-containing protein [Paludibacterium yongneupense]
MSIRPTLILSLGLLCSGPLLADSTVYRYVDRDGTVTFTNLPLPGARPFPLAPVKSPRRNGANAGPQVDAGTQQRRDQTRRQILQQELDNERKALAAARNALQRAGDRGTVASLQAAVTEHEKNIAAISTEMVH